MTLKKYIIPNQKELYRHKHYLFSLDLEFSHKTQTYENNSYLSYEVEFELQEFLNNNGFKFEISNKEINDIKSIVNSKYKTLYIDENNLFVVENRTNEKLFFINSNSSTISILDIKKSIFETFQTSNKEAKLALKTLEILASEPLFKNLFEILSILENQNKENILLLDKIKKFKYFCITKIKNLQQDGFLCNCVPGFFPETKFYIKANRVFSSYTNYFLDYEQELKVFKYLFTNQNLVGVFKEPTLYELFVGRKIYTIDEFGSRVKRVIKSAKNSSDNRVKIVLSDGVNSKELSNDFDRQELLNRVIEARD